MSSIYIGEKTKGRGKGKMVDMKQGTGMQWEKGTLVYEGQYHQDKKKGRGVEYNRHATKVYNGEWLDDKYHGIGTEYDCVGRIVYRGSFEEGKREGKGRQWHQNHFDKDKPDHTVLMYNGDWVDSKWHGFGVLYHDNGKRAYQGHWAEGLK